MMGDLTPLFAATAPTLIAWKDDQLRAENAALKEEMLSTAKRCEIATKRADMLQRICVNMGYEVASDVDAEFYCQACEVTYPDTKHSVGNCFVCGAALAICGPCIVSNPPGTFSATYAQVVEKDGYVWYRFWCGAHTPAN